MRKRQLASLLLLLLASGCTCSAESDDAEPRREPAPASAAASGDALAPADLLDIYPDATPSHDAGPPPLPSASGEAPTPGPTPTLPDNPTLPEDRTSSEREPGTIMAGYGIPAHRSLVHLCGKRVIRAGGSLVWDAFTSPLTPDQLIAAYRKRLGERGFGKEGSGGTWRLGGASARVLTITDAGKPGRHRICEEKPPRDAKSAVVVSRQ